MPWVCINLTCPLTNMISNSKKNTVIALKKAQTSIAGILKMLDEDKYCIDILQQILAVNGLLRSASDKILENHLNTCFSEGMRSPNKNIKDKLVKEVLEVINIGNKKK